MSERTDLSRPSAGRLIIAFLLAPLAIVPATALLLVVAFIFRLGGFAANTSPLLILTSLVVISMFGVPMAYLTTVLLGIPAYLVARRRGLPTLRRSVVTGAVVALLPLYLFFAYVAAVDGLGVVRSAGSALGWTVLITLGGASSGAAFWWIALRHIDPCGRGGGRGLVVEGARVLP